MLLMCEWIFNIGYFWFPITLTETLLKCLKLISSNKHGHKTQQKQEV